jgi:hypothetical protein
MVNRFSPSDHFPFVDERHHNHGITFDRIPIPAVPALPRSVNGSPLDGSVVGKAHFIDSAETCTVADVQFEQRQMQPAAIG